MKANYFPLVLLLFISLIPATVHAEAFLDVYAGPDFLQDSKTTVVNEEGTSSSSFVADWRGTTTAGLRSGYWFPRLVGVAGDVMVIRPRSTNMDIDLVPLSVLAMFRLPLFVSDDMPRGRLQPYAGIGPSFSVYTFVDAHTGTTNRNATAWDWSPGFQIPAGFRLQLTPHWGIFSEYRYTYNRIDVDAIVLSPHNTLKANIRGHHMLFGTSWNF